MHDTTSCNEIPNTHTYIMHNSHTHIVTHLQHINHIYPQQRIINNDTHKLIIKQSYHTQYQQTHRTITHTQQHKQ